ncbi:MAG TPA: hypothetical protein PLX15_05580 [Candidatus Woesearchaeota archaeon]|mgnify:CR=1 FL=1|nr:hypothetical protein [Candidatus Woesearchaeota archaeon]
MWDLFFKEGIIIAKRRIEKVDKGEKNKKMLTIALVVITSILLMTSILEMVVNRNSQNFEDSKININNYTLSRSTSGWSLDYEKQKLDFTLSPFQVSYLTFDDDLLDKIDSSLIFYYGVNSSSEIVSAVSFSVLESSYNAQKAKKMMVFYGFEDFKEGKVGLNCENQTNAPIFIFRKGEEFEILKDETNEFCYYVYASTEFDVVAFSNALSYLKLGVINRDYFNKD